MEKSKTSQAQKSSRSVSSHSATSSKGQPSERKIVFYEKGTFTPAPVLQKVTKNLYKSLRKALHDETGDEKNENSLQSGIKKCQWQFPSVSKKEDCIPVDCDNIIE